MLSMVVGRRRSRNLAIPVLHFVNSECTRQQHAATAAFLPPQLCQFLAAHPDLSIGLEERSGMESAQALVERRAGLGILSDVTGFAPCQRTSSPATGWSASPPGRTRGAPGAPARLPHRAAQPGTYRQACGGGHRRVDSFRCAGQDAAARPGDHAAVGGLGYPPTLAVCTRFLGPVSARRLAGAAAAGTRPVEVPSAAGEANGPMCCFPHCNIESACAIRADLVTCVYRHSFQPELTAWIQTSTANR